MRLALVQQPAGSDLQSAILSGLEALHKAADQGAQLVAFPELAFMPFFPQERLTGDRFRFAETVPGPTTAAFSQAARERGVVVVLNLFEMSGERAYDSSPVIDADGTILGNSRMMHITQYEGFWEQDYYDPGDTGAPVFDTAVGKIGVCICYDRHYPEYMRSLALQGADLVIVPQAGALGEWPDGLFEAEMRVASFHNGFYTALANRVGAESHLTFGGGSFVTDPFGQVIGRAAEGAQDLLICDVDLETCARSPARSLFFQHRREGEYAGGAVRKRD